MKILLIPGAGTAGTLMTNRLRKRPSPEKWGIIDRVETEKNRVLLRSGERLKYEVLVH